MSKGEQTREMIIREAAAVFNRYGYFGTSMADIMRETGLEKGGIYNHFRSGKDELALAAFDYAFSVSANRMGEVFKTVRHAADRLIAFGEVFKELLDDRILPGGCPVMNTAIEADAHPGHPLVNRVREAMTAQLDMVQRIVEKGIERGEIKPDVDAQTISASFVSSLEGGVMLSKLYNDSRYLQRVIDHLRDHIETHLRA